MSSTAAEEATKRGISAVQDPTTGQAIDSLENGLVVATGVVSSMRSFGKSLQFATLEIIRNPATVDELATEFAVQASRAAIALQGPRKKQQKRKKSSGPEDFVPITPGESTAANSAIQNWRSRILGSRLTDANTTAKSTCTTHILVCFESIFVAGPTTELPDVFPTARAILRRGDVVRVALWGKPVDEPKRPFASPKAPFVSVYIEDKWIVHSWERLARRPDGNFRGGILERVLAGSGISHFPSMAAEYKATSEDQKQTPEGSAVVETNDPYDLLKRCKTTPLCRSLMRNRECQNEGCTDRHETNGPEEKMYLNQILARRAAVQKLAADEAREYSNVAGADGVGADQDAHSKGDKKKRSSLFAKWLISTFGSATLASGTGLADVAGGKGMVSVQVLLETDLPEQRCTVVDPFARRTPITKRTAKELKAAQRQRPSFIQSKLDDEYTKHAELFALLQDAGVIVGMHADQATGAIIECALALRRPFAVVPCCVFTQQFPDRMIPVEEDDDKIKNCVEKDDRSEVSGDGNGCIGVDGVPVAPVVAMKLVETTNELVRWLRAKHPNIQVEYLPFEGRNKVLFMKSEHYDE